MFVFFINLRNLGKFSIVSAFCSSFAEKEKMSMFSLFCGLIANFEYAGFAQKNKYTAWTVSIVTVFAAKREELLQRENQSECINLLKALPYN